jgi:predicted ATPase
VIDEPEMNLHPKAQVQLMEFLALLVSAGLQVLITTHSPYIVDHLANLMSAATRSDAQKEEIKLKFLLEKKEAFIDKKNVGIYLFENGTTENILDAEGLIHWKTFSDVSDRVSQIFFEI